MEYRALDHRCRLRLILQVCLARARYSQRYELQKDPLRLFLPSRLARISESVSWFVSPDMGPMQVCSFLTSLWETGERSLLAREPLVQHKMAAHTRPAKANCCWPG